MRKRTLGIAGIGFAALLFVGQALGAGTPAHTFSNASALHLIGQTQSGYSLDDGQDLVSRASIDIEQAVAAAQTVATGEIGEIDLEYVDGTLVFNVDVGDADVKVDAGTGVVVSTEHDD